MTMGATCTLLGIAPQFVVAEVVNAAEYYRDVLGFSIVDYFLDPPVFAMVERDGVQIHFGKVDDPHRPPEPNSRKRRVGFDAYVWVNGIDALLAELQASGAKIVEGPVRRVYGSREIVVEDCYGYRLAFGEFEE